MCNILKMFGESRTAYISRFPEEFPFYTIKVAAGFPPAAALIVLLVIFCGFLWNCKSFCKNLKFSLAK